MKREAEEELVCVYVCIEEQECCFLIEEGEDLNALEKVKRESCDSINISFNHNHLTNPMTTVSSSHPLI